MNCFCRIQIYTYHPCMVYLPTFNWLMFVVKVGKHTWMVWDTPAHTWDRNPNQIYIRFFNLPAPIHFQLSKPPDFHCAFCVFMVCWMSHVGSLFHESNALKTRSFVAKAPRLFHARNQFENLIDGNSKGRRGRRWRPTEPCWGWGWW